MSALAELAALAGVEPVVRDFFGNVRTVSPEATAAILGAMGFSIEGEKTIATAVAARKAERWLEMLAPAIVVHADETAFPCSAPQSDGEVAWRLTLESGQTFSGSLTWQECRRIDAGAIEGRPYERRFVQLPVEPPLGYHRLQLELGASRGETVFIVTPREAYNPPNVDRLWVIAAQLYALRSHRNWGIGDFTDLAAFGRLAQSLGAAAVALNPLHALYLTNPAACSPYSASSRRYLNALYLDIEAIPDFAECPQAQALVASAEFQESVHRLQGDPLVDYVATARLKVRVLHLLWQSFSERRIAPGDKRARAFRAFRRQGGSALTRFARYEAIAFSLAGGAERHVPWQEWPADLQQPQSAAVAAFARNNAGLVAESIYRQWLCDEQLASARAAAPNSLGLYLDLAVGIDAGGADAWADRSSYAHGASLGAPPDELNMHGQNWGLAPFNPRALRSSAYAPFIDMVRANMQRAGVLRMDHVMSLTRAYWIPPGLDATQGAYVSYPFDDLRGIVALESVRNGCLVVGEDLGTVPPGFRESLAGSHLLGCRLVVFERDGRRFRAPGEYARQAVASFATHDLPPLARWWIDADPATRAALLEALREARVLDETEPSLQTLADSIHAFLAQTNAQLAAVALEDVFVETERTNVPGTVDEHPNWRVKRALPVESLPADARMTALTAIFSNRDGRSAKTAAK